MAARREAAAILPLRQTAGRALLTNARIATISLSARCRNGENVSSEGRRDERLGNLLFYGIVVLLAYLVFRVFEPFLAALAWAVILVVLFFPVYQRLAKKWGKPAAALAATVGVTLILIVPTIFIMFAFVRQGYGAVQSIQFEVATGHFRWVNDLWLRIGARFPGAEVKDLGSTLREYGEQIAAYLAGQIGAVLRHTAAFIFHLSVTIFAMFYLFRDGPSLVTRLREILPFDQEHRDRMIRDSRDLIFASVTSSLVAAAAHGLLGGLAFGLTGIGAPVFWGVMMGFFSLVPVVGSALIWVPASISLMLGGKIVHGIILALICSVIVGMIDNIIRPWLISGRAEMGGLVVFISVLGGIAVFGMLGVVLGPIVVASAAGLLDLYLPSGGRNQTADARGS
jgi:predicted PurR-regulated permease PerM